MANGKNEVNLTIKADDQASKVIDDVATELEQLDDGAEVDVEADTRGALTNIQQLDRELEGLTDDAKELRIEFRAQRLQQQIRTALGAIERLDDPVELDIRTKDLQDAQADLRELAELAGKKYEIQIDADPKRTARQAADDIDGIREKGEGLQSAVPALRGFTDELGGTAAKAGIAGQAIADLGDFSLIMGEKLGLPQEATAKLGTALSALGLGGVIIGGVAAGFQFLQRGAQETKKRIDELTQGILDQLGVAEQIESRYNDAGSAYEAFADRLIEDEDDLADLSRIFGDLGLTIEDLPRVLQQIETGDLEDLIEAGLGGDEAADALRRMKEAGVDFSELNLTTGIIALDEETRKTLQPFVELDKLASGLHVNETAAETLAGLAFSSREAATAIEDFRENNPEASDVEILDLYIASLEGITDEAETSGDEMERTGVRGRAVWTSLGTAADNFATDVDEATAKAGTHVDRLRDRLDVLRGRLDMEQATLNLQAAFKTAMEKARTETGLTEQDVLDLKGEVLDYAEAVGNLPDEVITDVIAQIGPNTTEADLNNLLFGLQAHANANPIQIQTRVGRPVTSGSGFMDPYEQLSTQALGVTNNYFMPSTSARQVQTQASRWQRINGGP